MAHIRQSRPDAGRGVQVKVLETFQVVDSSLGSEKAGSVRKSSSPAAVGLTGCSQVDSLGALYKSVNFGVKNVAPKRLDQIDASCDKPRISSSVFGCLDSPIW